MSQELTNWLILHYGQEAYTPGLERVRRALGPLLPELGKKRIVTVAGTNGKGETTHRLRQLLKDRSLAVWTSPHIERLNERFSSEEGDISDADLEDLIGRCHTRVQALGHELTFYEFLFFVFCHWAIEKGAEVLLLEVGLGGRLDAVNVLNADLVLLTSISRDHQEFLGPRYDLILREKLGVTRPGKPLLTYLDLRYLRDRADAFCGNQMTPVLHLEDFQLSRNFEFSRRNHLLAYAAFLFFKGHSLDQLRREDLESSETLDALPHRGEIFRGQNEWHFYGSHNPDGVRKLIHFLHSANYNLRAPAFDLILCSFSRRSERDVRAMLKMLKGARLGPIVVTTFPHAKAFPASTLQELSYQEGLEFAQGREAVVQSRSGQRILVVGSYYFLGHLRSLLR